MTVKTRVDKSIRNLTLLSLLILPVALAAAFAENAAEAVAWKSSWHETAGAAKKRSRNILLLFTNPERCPPCRMMEQQTWPDAGVAKFVNANLVPLMIHTGRSEERSLGREFEIRGIPTTLVLDTKRNIIARKVGFSPPEDFLRFLRAAVSLDGLKKKVERDAENAAHALDLARAYVELERRSEAVPLLEKVCRLDRDNSKEKKVHALYLLGTIAFENGKTEDAKRKFGEVMGIDPKGKAGYADDIAFHLAIVLANERKFSSAAERFEKLMADFPKSERLPEALMYLGRCRLLTEDSDGAAKAFEKLIKEHPDGPYARHAKHFLQEIKQNKGKPR